MKTEPPRGAIIIPLPLAGQFAGASIGQRPSSGGAALVQASRGRQGEHGAAHWGRSEPVWVRASPGCLHAESNEVGPLLQQA